MEPTPPQNETDLEKLEERWWNAEEHPVRYLFSFFVIMGLLVYMLHSMKQAMPNDFSFIKLLSQ